MKKSHFVRVTMSMVFELAEPSDGVRVDCMGMLNAAMDGIVEARTDAEPWINIQPGATVEARWLDEARYLKGG